MSLQIPYFPVQSGPLKMVAGLQRHGVDTGLGARDQLFFQADSERAHYLREKRRAPADRHGLFGEDPVAQRAREAALAWLERTLEVEQPQALREARADRSARDPFEAIACAVQEDLAVMAAGEHDAGRTVMLDVRFPSGWRPERLAGASFAALHRPVPGFGDSAPAVQSMVRAMVERGPYVRFVWTLCGDEQLDHHPDVRRTIAWRDVERLWLRVERQVTVGLPEAQGSVFLIRTYLHPCSALSGEQHRTLASALQAMPAEVRAYKGLPQYAEVAHLLSP